MTLPENISPEFPSPPAPREGNGIKMMKALLTGSAKFISGINVRWVGCEPDVRQRVYFANHTCHLDAVVIWASLPPPIRALTRPVVAHDYWTGGRLRRYLADKVLCAVLIERKKSTVRENPLTAMINALGDHYSLIIFPEGDQQTGIDITPFKSGLFHLAKWRPDIEFVPVFIENLNRILPKGEILPMPLIGDISFGTPIKHEADEDKHAFLERAQAAVKALQQP